jgi:hypothetical protein
VISGTIIKARRNGARFRVSSSASDGAVFLAALDGLGYPSLWIRPEDFKDFEIEALPRDITEEQARAALADGGTRAYAAKYVRRAAVRDRLADELGLEPDDLPRDRPGMWRRVFALGPQP